MAEADQFRLQRLGIAGGSPLAEHSLHVFVEKFAEQRPSADAVVSHARGRHLRMSYEQLHSRTTAAAFAMQRSGLKAGDIVCVQLPNWPEFVVLMLAASRIGAVCCPITHIYRHFELKFILQRTKAPLLIIPSQFRGHDYAEMIRQLRLDTPHLATVVSIEGADGAHITSYEAFMSSGAGERHAIEEFAGGPDTPVILAFTSGTTGEPKGVIHTHRSLIEVISGVISHLGVVPPVVSLVPSPVGHLTGVIWGCLMTLMCGGTVVLQDAWDAREALALIQAEGVTFIAGATPFLSDLTQASKATSTPVPSLKTFICAGAPIPPRVVADAEASLSCRVHSAWGMSEYPIATAVGSQDPSIMSAESDGRAVPGADVRILAGDGTPSAVGEAGDLQVRGVGLFVGYYKRPDFDRDAFTEDGFLKTGDRAYWVNGEGFLRIAGRTKDIIIRGGENIPVFDIESLMLEHEGVRDVALVAMPDDRLGERACAYVVPENTDHPVTLAEIVQHLSRRGVAKQFFPERLELIDRLPRTPSGKVQKFKLREDVLNKLSDGPGMSL